MENLPQNLRWWAANYQSTLRYIRRSNTSLGPASPFLSLCLYVSILCLCVSLCAPVHVHVRVRLCDVYLRANTRLSTHGGNSVVLVSMGKSGSCACACARACACVCAYGHLAGYPFNESINVLQPRESILFFIECVSVYELSRKVARVFSRLCSPLLSLPSSPCSLPSLHFLPSLPPSLLPLVVFKGPGGEFPTRFPEFAEYGKLGHSSQCVVLLQLKTGGVAKAVSGS